MVSPPAGLPLTSSLPALPACRWGARPQNLRGQENNKGSDLAPLPEFSSSPIPHLHLPPGSSQEDPWFPGSLLLHRVNHPHSCCSPKPARPPGSRQLLPTFSPAGGDGLLAPLWSMVPCLSPNTGLKIQGLVDLSSRLNQELLLGELAFLYRGTFCGTASAEDSALGPVHVGGVRA